ncbi:hypothetical protein SAMN05216298_2512 [Glycomyces sambucus]|uniref:Lipoprotein n=1 Tax=Glycomyces sambucus TaxID=380244 RepID=A0A1G9GYZ6_9ACTN|nr:hypothetical protein [Glycomyces sambucus]SDL05825.1 hypothetical protein SAMN05216298_2512 [Glycomyces sambucus]
MNTKPLVVIAALALLAGCSSNGGQEDEPSGEPTVEEAAPPEVVAGAPIAFELEAPEGFVLADGEDRPDPLAANQVSQVFNLDGASPGNQILVTSYSLDAALAAPGFDGVLPVVMEYDVARGFEADPVQYRHAIVHRMGGVHRYLEIDLGGTPAKEYNHYFGQDTHLVQITCRWTDDFDAVMAGCESLEAGFPAPEGWQAGAA